VYRYVLPFGKGNTTSRRATVTSNTHIMIYPCLKSRLPAVCGIVHTCIDDVCVVKCKTVNTTTTTTTTTCTSTTTTTTYVVIVILLPHCCRYNNNNNNIASDRRRRRQLIRVKHNNTVCGRVFFGIIKNYNNYI